MTVEFPQSDALMTLLNITLCEWVVLMITKYHKKPLGFSLSSQEGGKVGQVRQVEKNLLYNNLLT